MLLEGINRRSVKYLAYCLAPSEHPVNVKLLLFIFVFTSNYFLRKKFLEIKLLDQKECLSLGCFFFLTTVCQNALQRGCASSQNYQLCVRKGQENVSSEWCPFTILSAMSITTKEREGGRTQRRKKKKETLSIKWGVGMG